MNCLPRLIVSLDESTILAQFVLQASAIHTTAGCREKQAAEDPRVSP